MDATTTNGRNNHKSIHLSGSDAATGIQDETVLTLIFRSINFDPHVVSVAACLNRRLRAVARHILWRELCIAQAPSMVAALSSGPTRTSSIGRASWHTLAKLHVFCCGSSVPHHNIPRHFMKTSRFSKTSGKSFLHRKCRGGLLYVSDPCEHTVDGMDEDLGVYRGVFRGFMRSKTRACLISKQVDLESRVGCPALLRGTGLEHDGGQDGAQERIEEAGVP